MVKNDTPIELRIPSAFGYEKMAMKLAGLIAEQVGFTPERVDDIKTAVSEACLNAIEHGNRSHADARVRVMFNITKEQLCIDIEDQGRGGPPPEHIPEPDIGRKVRGEERLRQMGLYVIRNLADEACFVEHPPGQGSVFRIVFKVG
jgi:serine/threonine-protein kinase RsbW